MEIVNKTTMNALAVIGFVAVLFGGMALAIYTARFVPTAVNGIAAATVSLFESFVPATNTAIVVEDTSEKIEIAAETGNTDSEEDISFPVETTSSGANASAPTTPGQEITNVTEIGGGAGVTAAPNGIPDLVPTIIGVGLMTGTSTSSFIPATTTLKSNQRIGVKFVIENRGSGATGEWRFTMIIPTDPVYVYDSTIQQSLLPGERIEYVLGYDRSKFGNELQLSLNADSKGQVAESNEGNNSNFYKFNVERGN